MAAAVIGAMRVVLGLDSATFTSGLTAAQKELRDAGAKMQRVGANLATAGAGMSAAITAPFIALGFHLLQGSQDAAAAAAQVNAALASMGDASGKTSDQLAKAAEDLRNLTGVDDDEILTKVTANLLTFGKVSGDVFDRAQLSVLNLSARMGSDLQGATMMVGKALNDPVQGLAALRRVGIQFTDGQQKMIKSMAEVGNVAGAQAIMLGELERQFGGAAEAAGKADIWMPMKTALMDLEGAFEPIVRDVVAPLIAKVAEIAKAFAGLSPQFITFAAVGAAVAAAIGPILIGLGAMAASVGAITAAFAGGGFLAALLPFLGPVALGVGAVVVAFIAFRDQIIPALQAFAKTAQETIGPYLPGLIATAKEAFAALGLAISAVVGVVAPVLGVLAKAFLAAFGPILLTMLRVMVAQVTGVLQVITNVLRFLAALLTGDWAGAWKAAGSVVMSVIKAIGGIVEAVFPGITGFVGRMVTGVTGWLQGKLFDVLRGVIDKVKGVSDAFFRLYDAVVGNSYVPDMVTEVGQWMSRLDAGMVVPAKKATEAAATAFEAMRDRVASVFDSLLTDRERLTRGFASDMKTLNDALEAGPARGGITRAQYDDAVERRRRQKAIESAGLDAEGLTLPNVPQLRSLDSDGSITRLNETFDKMRDRIRAARDDFADAFSYGVEAAMNGDWTSVLQTVVSQIFGGTLQDAFRKLGGSLFDNLGGGKGGGINLGSIGKSIGSLFGKIPGFDTGGSFKVGGSGGADSKLFNLRLTPGEMVDVRRPGQFPSEGGRGPINFDMRGAVMTADLMAQAEHMASQSGGNALRTARVAVPADQAKADRYKLGGRRR